MERISPVSDLGFKKVLASDENKDILAGLIKDFFGIEAEDIVIEKPYSISICKEFIEGGEVTKLRQTLKDVAATFKSADFISEVQVNKTQFFDERALYYPFEKYCQNYSEVGAMKVNTSDKPIRYSSLRPVYALNILGYTHFEEDAEALRIFELYDPKRRKRYKRELLRIGFFELSKLEIETANQKHWHEYFTTGEAGADAPAYIKKAGQVIEYVNLREEERVMISTLERLEANEEAQRYSIFLDGIVEGEKRSEESKIAYAKEYAKEYADEKLKAERAEMAKTLKAERAEIAKLKAERLEMAKTLLKNKVDISIIMETTGLSITAINKEAKKIK